MSSTYTLETDIIVTDAVTRTVTIVAGVAGADVSIATKGKKLDEKKFVAWDKMDDIEHLSQLFRTEPVCVFREIVMRLGPLHSSQEIFK